MYMDRRSVARAAKVQCWITSSSVQPRLQTSLLETQLSGKDVFVALPTGFGKSLCLAVVKHGLQSTAGSCARYPTQQKAKAHLNCSIEGQSERAYDGRSCTAAQRPFPNFVFASCSWPSLYVDLTHTTLASNCPALHIPQNRVDLLFPRI